MKQTPTAHQFEQSGVRSGFTVNRYAFMNSPSRSFDVKRSSPKLGILQTFTMVGMLAAALIVGGKWVEFVAPDSGATMPASITQPTSGSAKST
ncbi:MAG: hypothetical protein ACKVHO_15450 [Verrucomicrobiia bacterium]|jgi:hypothetical protein